MSRPLILAVTSIALGIPAVAGAHFKLLEPASQSVEDPMFGSPQKSAPCGITDDPNVADQSMPTNMITTVKTGSMLSISIVETIAHPGHYRVALAKDPSGLPADPPVTPGTKACGTTTIDASPALPLLADGLLVHTSSFGSATKTMQVQLPPGMTCTNCVLQVVEFMSAHPLNNPGGCFYHHCARLTISDTAPPPVDAGVGGDASTTGGGAGGCGVAPGASGLGVLLVGLLAARRRRRQPHATTA